MTTSKDHELRKYGIRDAVVHCDLTPAALHRISIEKKMGREADSGALAVRTGRFTGRSPQDRFIVEDDITRDKVWWGEINKPFDPAAFDALYKRVTEYLSGKELYVRSGYVCAEPRYRLNIRAITEYPWSNLFVYNMFLRPTEAELAGFEADWSIVNAPGFEADPQRDKTRQGNFAILNFSRKILLIGGTGYTGEIKKGIFSALNFYLPTMEKVLAMHCSANVGKDGNTAIFFGLSGTGKTTLSADPNRKLIGDDEHGWTEDDEIFNFEGGCYAKVIDLSEEKEPDIYHAIRKGALLENVVFESGSNRVDFSDSSITQNTRVSYPIDHIAHIQKPSIGKNPKNIFFLTADAFGVLPPISKLTPGQAAFHFISGYTAKVAGTEAGITTPVPYFSACFGAPFMPLHPAVYGDMLSRKMKRSNTNVWLVNTGWSGGGYGTGSRIKLRYTRAMIHAALRGELEGMTYQTHPVFGLKMPETCPEVPCEILNPKNTWEDPVAYDTKVWELAEAFHQNFKKFEAQANDEVRAGAPKRREKSDVPQKL